MMEGNRIGGTKERAEAFNVLDGQYVYTYRLAAGSKAQDEPQPTPQQASKQKMEHEPPKEIKKDVGFFLIRKRGPITSPTTPPPTAGVGGNKKKGRDVLLYTCMRPLHFTRDI